MHIVHDLPHAVEHEEHVWIPMSDGTRLSARIWRPEGSTDRPVPAILEYLPYRRRDGTRARDALNHPYFAGHGYACVRVDMRGSGDADGVLADEYLPQEQEDGLEILRWLAERPWCDGKVGMIGISWGGFNGLQIAAHRPPELKAVITICSTDDRYADDVHYMGGCLLGDNLAWSSTMVAENIRPPDPQTAGAEWRERWMERLEGHVFWLEPWLEHGRRDDYWKQGSVCEDLSRIECPVFAVGGWADAYSNAIFRLLAGLDVPRLGLIGPWGHAYPHMATPGPAVGFLQEALRFWDRWLKDEDTGIMAEPTLRAWMQESVPPARRYEERPGRWVGEGSWPSPQVEHRSLPLSQGRILAPGTPVPEGEPELALRSPLSVGLDAGTWCYYGGADLPGDQRAADGGSLTFDSEPLTERVEILGAPVVELELRADEPVAMVAVRLEDVLPDGRSTRVTYGLLNLTHRDSHEWPEPLVPGRTYRVRVAMNDIAQAFPVGHRIRLAVSTSYWPLAWPSPKAATLTVRPGGSGLSLPVREPRAEDEAVTVQGRPEAAEPLRTTVLTPPAPPERNVFHDQVRDETVLEVRKDRGRTRIDEIDLEVASSSVERYSYRGDDPDTARAETEWEFHYARGDWNVRTRSKTALTGTADAFRTYAEVDAYEGDERVFSRTYVRDIERKLV